MAQDEYKKQMDLLTSIKGIGVILATALIVATDRFTYFNNAKQFTRYLDLSPTLLTNNPVCQSMSKVTSTETGAQASEASSMWLLSSYSDTIPNVKFVSTICDLTENPAEGRQQTCKANLRYYLHAEENLYQWIQVYRGNVMRQGTKYTAPTNFPCTTTCIIMLIIVNLIRFLYYSSYYINRLAGLPNTVVPVSTFLVTKLQAPICASLPTITL